MEQEILYRLSGVESAIQSLNAKMLKCEVTDMIVLALLGKTMQETTNITELKKQINGITNNNVVTLSTASSKKKRK